MWFLLWDKIEAEEEIKPSMEKGKYKSGMGDKRKGKTVEKTAVMTSRARVRRRERTGKGKLKGVRQAGRISNDAAGD